MSAEAESDRLWGNFVQLEILAGIQCHSTIYTSAGHFKIETRDQLCHCAYSARMLDSWGSEMREKQYD